MRRAKSKPCVMLILLSMHLIAKERVMENVVISDGTLFCRLQREEGEMSSKWNKVD